MMNENLIDLMQRRQKNGLYEFYERYNNTAREISCKTLAELFESQAEITPSHIAISEEENEMTYLQLNKAANKMAGYLRNKGIIPGTVVGILTERGLRTIIGILGILKAGAAYVPIDPDYPEERKKYIRENSNCTCEINSGDYNVALQDITLSEKNMSIQISPQTLAYIIYTSGSTGEPKGVAITHEAVINTILDMHSKFPFSPEDKAIGISSFSFDLSVFDIFGTLLCGAELVQISTQKDIDKLRNIVDHKKITIWNSVPALMEIYLSKADAGYRNEQIRYIFLSGDWIPISLPAKMVIAFPNAKLISLGGATEASIWSIYHEIKSVNPKWKSIPYGKPLANQKFYVLNYNQELCPLGVQGELYIGGIGLAEGYYRDIERTKQAFILHPSFGRLYRTGDYGVMHQDGYIEFMGRKDSQVKINGYRVELGEIEACLDRDESVKKAVAVNDFEGGNAVIRAYIVPQGEMRTQAYYKNVAMKALPDYMVPVSFIEVEEIPLSANGKVNRKQLLLLGRGNESNAEYVVPEIGMESELAELIQTQLGGGRKIGRTESLYNVGLNSVMMMSIINQIQGKYRIKVNFRDFMKINNLTDLALYISKVQSENPRETGEMEHIPVTVLSMPVDNKEEQSLFQMLQRTFGIYKNGIAISSSEEEITYQELNRKLLQTAERIADLRAPGQNTIALISDNRIQFIINLLGSLKCNLTPVIIDNRLEPEEKEKIIVSDKCFACLTDEVIEAVPINGKAGQNLQTGEYLKYCYMNTNKELEEKNNKQSYITEKMVHILADNHLDENDRVLCLAEAGGEINLLGMLTSLMAGCTLVLAESEPEFDWVIKIIEQRHISVLAVMPEQTDTLLAQLCQRMKPAGIRSYEEGALKYYWAPAVQWYLQEGKVFINEKFYKELTGVMFPEIYFILQKGLYYDDIIRLFQKYYEEEKKVDEAVHKLMEERVIICELQRPEEIFSTQKKLFSHDYGEQLIYDTKAYHSFKAKQLNRSVYTGEYISLADTSDLLGLCNRRSCREFDKERKLPFTTLAKYLSFLRQVIHGDSKRYYYPSAGGFYPIDLYLYIKRNRVEGLEEGIYYYNPINNAIIKINHNTIDAQAYYFQNKDIFETSAVSLYFVYNARVTMPNYGYMGYYYACLDTGIMAALLALQAEKLELGTCSIGDFDTGRLINKLDLDKNEMLLHILEFGMLPRECEAVKDETIIPETSFEFAATEESNSKLLKSLRSIMVLSENVPSELEAKIRAWFRENGVPAL